MNPSIWAPPVTAGNGAAQPLIRSATLCLLILLGGARSPIVSHGLPGPALNLRKCPITKHMGKHTTGRLAFPFFPASNVLAGLR